MPHAPYVRKFPISQKNVEQLSRVTGYLQAVSGWNAAKKQELEDRKRYGGTDMV
ncbi:MAG: hypothetical protein KAU52_03060 [Methanosarcinales archaeon]|nr:hypothetical protein [Methanosarcinales archaeon]MCK4811702.1 hypothetical protein [Methanosarcinales archaeon]